jgi:hypothetical protein
MGKLSITLATWDYDRIQGIKDGSVQVEGCDVTHIVASPKEADCGSGKYIDEMGLDYWPYGVDRNRG